MYYVTYDLVNGTVIWHLHYEDGTIVHSAVNSTVFAEDCELMFNFFWMS